MSIYINELLCGISEKLIKCEMATTPPNDIVRILYHNEQRKQQRIKYLIDDSET